MEMNFFPMRHKPHLVQGLIDLIDFIDRAELTLVEIGSYIGESAEIFLDTQKVSTLYAIDPWRNGYDDNDQASSQAPMELVEEAFDSRMKKYTNKVIKLKDTSDNALEYFLKNKLQVDVVYIDGNHKREYVYNDIKNYINILKPNGFLSGHDWQSGDVQETLLEVLGRYPDKIFQDKSWAYKLGKL